MGASFQSVTFEGTKEQLSKWYYKELIPRLNSEYGHQQGYSGHFNSCDGLSILNKEFNSRSEAMNYLDSNLSKREVAAVQFWDDKNGSMPAKPDKIKLKLKDAYDKAYEDVSALKKLIIKSLKEAVSKTIGCDKCGSKLNRNYLNSQFCPLCGNNLVSATNQKRLEFAKQKLEKFEKAYNEYKSPLNTKGKVLKWLVGGVCPE